jgi:hypothetical protein
MPYYTGSGVKHPHSQSVRTDGSNDENLRMAYMKYRVLIIPRIKWVYIFINRHISSDDLELSI